METTISIHSVTEAKTKKDVTFWKVVTNTGGMTAWKEDVAMELRKNIGNEVLVDVQQSGDFSNIRKFISASKGAVEMTQEVPQETQVPDKYKAARESKDASFYTAYAKDIFVAINTAECPEEESMARAIKLVNQARNAF